MAKIQHNWVWSVTNLLLVHWSYGMSSTAEAPTTPAPAALTEGEELISSTVADVATIMVTHQHTEVDDTVVTTSLPQEDPSPSQDQTMPTTVHSTERCRSDMCDTDSELSSTTQPEMTQSQTETSTHERDKENPLTTIADIPETSSSPVTAEVLPNRDLQTQTLSVTPLPDDVEGGSTTEDALRMFGTEADLRLTTRVKDQTTVSGGPTDAPRDFTSVLVPRIEVSMESDVVTSASKKPTIETFTTRNVDTWDSFEESNSSTVDTELVTIGAESNTTTVPVRITTDIPMETRNTTDFTVEPSDSVNVTDYNVTVEVCTADSVTHNTMLRAITSLTFDWTVTDGSGSDCASVQLCINPPPSSGPSCNTLTGTTGSETFTNLTPGTEHTATLIANKTGGGNDSTTATGKTLPTAPTGVNAVPGSPPQTTLTVSWSNPDGGYDKVQVLCDPPGGGGTPEDVTKPETSYDCTGLTAGTAYTVTVTTFLAGETPVSAPSVTADTDVLNPPTDVTVTAGSDPTTALSVSWTPPSNYYDKMIIECATPGETTVPLEVPKASGNSGECTGLVPGAVYNVTVSTALNTELPAPAPASPVQAITVPKQPSSFSFTGKTTTSLTVSISKPSDPCGQFDTYKIEYGAGSPKNVPANCSTPDPTSATIDGLTAGTTYSVSVATCSNGVCGTAIGPQDNTTLPKQPSNFSFTGKTTTSLNVSISKPSDPCGQFDTYKIEYGAGSPKNVPADCSTQDPTSATIDGLTAGTTYSVSVATCSNGVCGTATGPQNDTTHLNAPNSPVVGDVNETSIEVSWTEPVGNYDNVMLTCTGEGNDGSSSAPSGTFTAMCTGLTPGAVYTLSLCTHISGDPVPPACTTPPDTITVPSTPIIGDITQNTTAFSFNITPGAGQCSQYEITFGSPGSERNVSCASGSPTPVVLPGLDINTEYPVTVVTLSTASGGLTPKESTPASVTNWTAPNPVTALMVVSQGSRWVIVNFTESTPKPENIAEYHLTVTGDGISACHRIAAPMTPAAPECPCDTTTLSNTTSPYNVTGLTPYTDYTFSVVAVNPGTCSMASEDRQTRTDEDIPGTVSDLTVVGPSDLTVNWTEPSEPNGVITSYSVVWCELHPIETPSDTCDELCCSNAITEENVTEYVIEGLLPFYCYHVSVSASTSVGMGEYKNVTETCTGIGAPYAPIITNTVAISAFAINVTWKLEEDAHPTGEFVNYNATATAPGSMDPYSYSLVEGFNSTSALISGLEPYVNYSIRVIALTNSTDGSVLSTPSEPEPQLTEEFYPAAVNSFTVNSRAPESCHAFHLTWSHPSKQNGNRTGYQVKYQGDGDSKSVTYGASVTTADIECLNPNDIEYTFMIQAVNSIGSGNETSRTESSGECPPSTPVEMSVSESVSQSQTSVIVEIDKCEVCYNSNGDVTFAGLVLTEQSSPINTEEMFTNKAALDAEFGTWDNHSDSGYRTTPDNWQEEFQCDQVRDDCRGVKQPECGSTRRKRAVVEPYRYVVGEEGGCGKNEYCNNKLTDGKKFILRLVVGTDDRVLVAPSANVYETDPNMAWVAGVVIPLLLLVAAAVAVLVIMYKRRIGYTPTTTTSMDSLESVSLFTQHRPKPCTIDDFARYVSEHQRDSDLLFADEYKLVQELSPKHPTDASEHPSNRLKNRFTNILPFDHSRVKLLPADDDDCSDYINANYMPGYNSKREFIASQGPMKSTLEDFWRMIWEQNVAMIVMVTQLEERGRERCAKYWPNDNEPMYYGDLQVQMRSESVLDSYVIRILDVRLGEIERTIKQMHFIRWPDFGVPERPEQVLDFVCDVRSHTPHSSTGPVLVHCSAGVGRTGTYIAVDRLLQHIKENDTIDIFGVIMEMRNYRCYMIQVEAQFILIHKCVLKALERGLHRQLPYNQPQPDEAIYANQDYAQDNIYENAPGRMAEHGL